MQQTTLDETILFLPTGGTFDLTYHPEYIDVGQEFIFTETYLDEMLARARVTVPTRIQYPLPQMKISKHLTDEDRALLIRAATAAPESRIIVTHGTNKLVETAAHLAAQVPNKTVIVIGAMIPYTLKQSDALFNLGAAVIAAQTLSSGAYVVMNGQVRTPECVRKNTETGMFETIDLHT